MIFLCSWIWNIE